MRESPGFTAIVVLSVLTVIEYFVSAEAVAGAFFWLLIISIAKAAIILVAFMHLRNIFGNEHS